MAKAMILTMRKTHMSFFYFEKMRDTCSLRHVSRIDVIYVFHSDVRCDASFGKHPDGAGKKELSIG